MSAFLCSEDLINLIVNASDDPNPLLFDELVEANLASLRYRYGAEETNKTDAIVAKEYKFRKISPRQIIAAAYSRMQNRVRYYPAVKMNLTDDLIAAQIRKACDCFDYQACETPEWQSSRVREELMEIQGKYPKNENLEDVCIWGF